MALIDHFKIITITHHQVNVDEIGHFVVHESNHVNLQTRLKVIQQTYELDELIYLSTCNRVAYIVFSEKEIDHAFLSSFFRGINPAIHPNLLDKIEKFVDVYEGAKAVQHLFEVASSMDSLVVGEREIFRQLRESYNKSHEAGLTGDHLRLLIRYTVEAAKSVYAQTKIGEKPLSIVSLAMDALLKQKVNKDDRILIIGAGETNTLFAKFLKKHQFKNAIVFNRSIHNTNHIVKLLDAEAHHLSELNHYENGFDVMIVCTGSTEPIITKELYKKLIQGDHKSKIVIDLSVPNNVAKEVVEAFAPHYIDIEQLRSLSQENLAFRKNELKKAKKIIRDKLLAFNKMYQQRQIEKAMSIVPQKIKEVKHKALSVVYKNKYDQLDEETQLLIQDMMNYMEKKCISIPMMAVKDMES